MTSEPAPEKPAAPLPPSSACLGLLQRPSRIASRRPACAAAVLLITVLVPLVTGAAPLPPRRSRRPAPATRVQRHRHRRLPSNRLPHSRLLRLPQRTRSASPACRSSGSPLKRLARISHGLGCIGV